MFYKNTKITKNSEYLTCFYLCNRKYVLLDQGAQYYCLNLDIQVMKFLVLLMAPGFHFLWMTLPPKMTYHGYHHSLFLPHPLQYHIHVISGDKYNYINFTIYKYNLEKVKGKFLLSD